jgi:hypothetical protein
MDVEQNGRRRSERGKVAAGVRSERQASGASRGVGGERKERRWESDGERWKAKKVSDQSARLRTQVKYPCE